MLLSTDGAYTEKPNREPMSILFTAKMSFSANSDPP